MVSRLYLLAWFAVIAGNVALGLYIGYQAYRGFRRHESGPMRYLSIGLILLTAVASSIAFANLLGGWSGVLTRDIQVAIELLYRVLQFVGLGFIAYSLYVRS